MKMIHGNLPAFTQSNVVEATGLPKETLQHLVNRDVLKDVLGGDEADAQALDCMDKEPGKGNRRMYSICDAIFFAALQELLDFGIPPRRAAFVANHVRAYALTEGARKRWDWTKIGQHFLGVSAVSERKDNEFIIAKPSLDALHSWASEYDHPAYLVIDATKIINRVAARLLEDEIVPAGKN